MAPAWQGKARQGKAYSATSGGQSDRLVPRLSASSDAGSDAGADGARDIDNGAIGLRLGDEGALLANCTGLGKYH